VCLLSRNERHALPSVRFVLFSFVLIIEQTIPSLYLEPFDCDFKSMSVPTFIDQQLKQDNEIESSNAWMNDIGFSAFKNLHIFPEEREREGKNIKCQRE